MADKPVKRYLFASDFDQTLTFNDCGYVLSGLTEQLLCLWLLVIGVNVQRWKEQASAA